MASKKICKAIATVFHGESVVEGTRVQSSVTLFSPESGCEPFPVHIHPDANGEMWYWTPEPEIPVDAE